MKIEMEICPFCKEDGFDIIGVKHHLEMGWCEAYEQIPDLFDNSATEKYLNLNSINGEK